MDQTKEISPTIREFILKEFLPGEDSSELNETTPLITAGILDSIATLKLVAFLERQYHITLEPHEAGVDFLNTIADIAKLVQAKLSAHKSE
jgi:acyl carrier protein